MGTTWKLLVIKVQ